MTQTTALSEKIGGDIFYKLKNLRDVDRRHLFYRLNLQFCKFAEVGLQEEGIYISIKGKGGALSAWWTPHYR